VTLVTANRVDFGYLVTEAFTRVCEDVEAGIHEFSHRLGRPRANALEAVRGSGFALAGPRLRVNDREDSSLCPAKPSKRGEGQPTLDGKVEQNAISKTIRTKPFMENERAGLAGTSELGENQVRTKLEYCLKSATYYDFAGAALRPLPGGCG
jgi:hypothetical protein